MASDTASASSFGLEGQVALAEARTARGTREIRAVWSETTVRVYQAYNAEIAEAAVRAQRFVAPWRPDRMTWIKPSAVWMGYRCGWAAKDANQARVLAIDLHRAAFDALLCEAVLADAQDGSREQRLAQGPADVVVQWDPERALGGGAGREALTHSLPEQRSLQMGLRGGATRRYAAEGGMIAAVSDVTDVFVAVRQRLEAGDVPGAEALLPAESRYPVPEGCEIADPVRLGAPAADAARRAAAEGRSGSELRSLQAGPYYTPGASGLGTPHLVPRPEGM